MNPPVVQQLESQPARGERRVCVRLDPELTVWLEERSRETGSTSSEVLRSALRTARGQSDRMKALMAATKAQKLTIPQDVPVAVTRDTAAQTATAAKRADVPLFPRELWPVVAQLRGFGPTSWTERRRRFVWLVALAQVCVEMSQSASDGEVLADLLRLGAKYRLLTV